MYELTYLFLINLLCLWAVYASFKPGMIFGDIREWIEGKLRGGVIIWLIRRKDYTSISEPREIAEEKVDYWLKPVWGCPVCMPTVWAAPVYLIASFTGLIGYPWYLFIIYHLSMVGLNYIVSQLISKEVDVNLNQ